MGSAVTSVLVGLIGLVLLAASPAIGRRLVRGWTVHSTFFLVLYLAPIFAILVAAVTQAKFQSHDEFGAPELISIENRTVSDASLILAMSIGVWIFLRAAVSGAPLAIAPAALCIAATALTYLSNLREFGGVLDLPLLGMFAVFLGTAVGADPRSIGKGVTAGALVLVLVSCAVGVSDPAITSLPCSLGKCGPTGELFNGALNNENQLAITVASALPFVLLVLDGLPRWIVSGAIVSIVVLSGSRSSLIAVALLLVLWLFARRPGAARLLGPVVLLAGLAALILPLTVRSDAAFTGRGGLWKLALSMVQSSPFIGLGQDAWAAQAAVRKVGSNAGYSPHNLWLDGLVAGGWIAVLLVIAALLIQVRRTGAMSVWVLLPLAMGVFLGFTERSFTYYDLTSTTAFFLPALIAMAAVPAVRSAGPPALEPALRAAAPAGGQRAGR